MAVSACANSMIKKDIPFRQHKAFGRPIVRSARHKIPASCEINPAKSQLIRCSDCDGKLVKNATTAPNTGADISRPRVRNDNTEPRQIRAASHHRVASRSRLRRPSLSRHDKEITVQSENTVQSELPLRAHHTPEANHQRRFFTT